MAEALQQKIGIIGAGKIGAAMARGMVRAGLARPDQIMASDVSKPLRQALAAELGVEATPSNLKLCDFADIVILAVKPQVIDSVVKEIAKKVGKTKLVVSDRSSASRRPPAT